MPHLAQRLSLIAVASSSPAIDRQMRASIFSTADRAHASFVK